MLTVDIHPKVRLLPTTPDHSHLMTGSHDPIFVVLSLLIAMLASYAALDLAGRVRSAEGSTRYGWLAGGATVMGLGIWSMHFVAMLAFRLPTPIAYDVPRVLLSVGVAIGASLLALLVVSRPHLRPGPLVAGGVLMGVAIAGMHYIGMASMRVGAVLTYRQPMVLISIVIAILASIAALWLAFSFRSVVTLRGRLLKSLSAVVMGGAIAGMHYSGMSAAQFLALPQQITFHPAHVIATNGLAVGVVVGTLTILCLALIGAVIDRNIQSKIELNRQLTTRTIDLAYQVEQSRQLSAELEKMSAELQRARWLEGVAETTTAVAHEVNNPLTALIMNAELLEDVDARGAGEVIAEIRNSARRIAAVIDRLKGAIDPRSVTYVGKRRMIDLSLKEQE